MKTIQVLALAAVVVSLLTASAQATEHGSERVYVCQVSKAVREDAFSKVARIENCGNFEVKVADNGDTFKVGTGCKNVVVYFSSMLNGRSVLGTSEEYGIQLHYAGENKKSKEQGVDLTVETSRELARKFNMYTYITEKRVMSNDLEYKLDMTCMERE